MKFKSIKLHNFMRYKGDTEIAFSTDSDKNVTIILGDNTFGKTTLAQAFRWILYDELQDTSYSKRKDAVLLNNEVIADMGTKSANVEVEIVVLEDEKEYFFKRVAYYVRKYPMGSDLSIKQTSMRLTLQIAENGVKGKVIDNADKGGPVDTIINGMFPRSLSNYLFFDGERWNNEKSKKNDIRESINTITGLSGVISMARHLTGGRNNAKAIFESKRVNTSDEMKKLDDILADNNKKAMDKKDEADKIKEQIEALDLVVSRYKKQLDDNITMEKDQKDLKNIENEIERAEKAKVTAYNSIINKISNSAVYIAAGVSPEITALLETVDLSGKDIPGVTTATIDYLCQMGECLCGAKIDETNPNETFTKLSALKKLIPPAMIGGMVGRFESKLEAWRMSTEKYPQELEDLAVIFRNCIDTLDDKKEEKERIERRIDKRLNLADIRAAYNKNKTELDRLNNMYQRLMGQVEVFERKRDEASNSLSELSKKDGSNKKVERMIAYTDALYDLAIKVVKSRQAEIVEQLNVFIRENFDKMFSEKDKYASLDSDFQLHTYYRNLSGKADVEETSLSNGEMIAVNFVFIVSILELAKKIKEEEKEEENNDSEFEMDTDGQVGEEILQLPLVLDAPFSNLSNQNTALVASKLPEFAEQIIIFMLDKDWEASGLSDNVLPGYCYHVHKDASDNNSIIVADGGDQ